MNTAQLEEMFNVTESQLDELAQPYEQGIWPQGKTTLLGRPRLAEEEVRTVTFKLPISQIAALDKLAQSSGRTRSDTLREAIAHELAAAAA